MRTVQLQYLEEHGLPVPPYGSDYSINRGLWGVTIGGKETLDSVESIPESAWVLSAHAFTSPTEPEQHTIEFAAGVPVALDEQRLAPVDLNEAVEKTASAFGIGRGVHLGDTVLGTKGRVAYGLD